MNSTRLILCTTALALLVSGCSSLPSWMGGRKKEVERLPGDRIAVLPVGSEMQADDGIKDMPVTLPPVNNNSEWAQHTGMITSSMSNLAGGSFERESSARAGDGEAFEQVLIPRPVVGGGLVFAMDAEGKISAHDAGNIGNVRWTSQGATDTDEQDTIGGGLAYDQGKLYAVSGRGMVVALDASTGKEIWHKALKMPFRSAPRVSDGKIFIITLDNQFYALSAGTGDILWTQRGISETAGIMTSVSPVVQGDTVIVPYSSGEIYALSASDGHEQWSDSLSAGTRTQSTAFFGGIGGDPVVDNSVLVTVSSAGMLAVSALATGEKIWQRPIGSLNAPWVTGDFIYLLTTDNTLVAIVKYDGRIRWSTKLKTFEDEEDKKDPITWKGPVMVDGKLAVVGSNGELDLVSATDGKMVATHSIPSDIYTAPVVAGGKMYLESKDAELYELQ